MIRALAILAPLAQPVGVHAPKGFPGRVVEHHATIFLYAGYSQETLGASAGGGAKMLQANPALAAGDAHTLGELAVISADGRQIVEIGWHVDLPINNDVQPRLFVFHWVDGEATCYNGCGFVETSTTHRPGMRVTAGQIADYGIELRGSDWWLAYQGVDLGYFPGSLWPSGFTAAGNVQWFGEIAGERAEPCTEMGTGIRGATAGAATMTDLYLVRPGGMRVTANAVPGMVTSPALYDIGQLTPSSFAFGGPGAAFGCCTPTTCTAAAAACGRVPDPQCGEPVPCGSCATTELCDSEFQCVTAPPRPDSTDPVDGGGCCGAGRDASSMVPAILALFALRRRSRVSRREP
ncbi:MAG: neprosin family prolyl endopeptidase [Deltaproteobacteria bacterium]|nr:neprosin family prolyl endopeptidase [Deltaproteobacteria bacterium]